MADYVVRLTGQDNLSSTVKQVKKELNDIGNVGNSAMDKIDKKFNRIINSSAPLKRQLKDLQQIMADMNMKGLSNTNEFTRIAVEAGKIKDAMSDAAEAVRNYSDDTMALKATVQAFQGVAAAGSVATGVMALFGNENKEAAVAIQKVQGALAILNGVQTVANMLNENSVLVLKMKHIAQIVLNRSTADSTRSINENTIAVQANEKATKAMNSTLGAGKMAVGGWLAVITVGISLLSAYSAHAAKTKAAQAEMNAIIEQSKQTQKSYTDVMASTYSQLVTKYTQLKNEYKNLSTEHQKTEWIKKNKTELDNLQLSVDGVTSAENVFVNNTDAVVQAFIKRAKAAARYEQLKDLYKERGNLIDSIADDAKKGGRSAQEGDEITDATFRNKRYGSVNSAGKWVFSKAGAELYSGNANSNNPQVNKIDHKIDKLTNEMIKEGDFTPSLSTTTSTGGKTRSGGGSTNKPNVDDTPKYAKDSLSDLEHQLSDLQQKLKDGLIPEDEVGKTIESIESLKDQILKKEILLGIKIDPKLKEDEATKKKLIEQVEDYFKDNQDIELAPTISTFDKAIGNNPFDTNTLDGMERMIDFNDTLISSLENSKAKLEELKQSLIDAGMQGTESFNSIVNELDKVNGSIATVTTRNEELSEQAGNINNAKSKIEEQSEAWGYYSDMLGGVTNAMGVLGQTQEAQMAQFAVNTASILANAVSTIAAMNAEALAKGASSAFSLPFPANLAAWATVFATITSIFASLPKFAEGGIIGGGSSHGDTVLSRLNSGEMVLNPRQQSNLFKAINSGEFGFDNQTNETPSIQFKIKGSDLYGSLKNYSKTAGVSGKITGIK